MTLRCFMLEIKGKAVRRNIKLSVWREFTHCCSADNLNLSFSSGKQDDKYIISISGWRALRCHSCGFMLKRYVCLFFHKSLLGVSFFRNKLISSLRGREREKGERRGKSEWGETCVGGGAV